MVQKWLLLGFLLLLPLGALTCSKAKEQRHVLRVGFVPAENAQQVALNAQPIVLILQKDRARNPALCSYGLHRSC
jgi:ABC-type phosphate/phosphonate transport system substrate-binding protein